MLTIIKKIPVFILFSLILIASLAPIIALGDLPTLNIPENQPGQSVIDKFFKSEFVQSSPVKDLAGVQTLLETLVRWFQYIFFLAAVVFVIIAAFNYLTSKGEPEKVKTANKSLIYAAVAIAIALIGGGLVAIVKSIIQ